MRIYERTAPKHIGKTFVCLTIDAIEYRENSRVYANCTCDCGKTCSKRLDSVLNGRTIACSAKCTRIHNNTLMLGNRNPAFKGTGNICSTFLQELKRSAERRDIYFDHSVDTDYLWKLFKKQNCLCALTGLELSFGTHMRDTLNRTASVDRIDSNKGYTKDNIQFVHKQINMLKTNIDEDTFIQLCILVAEHHG